MPVISWPFDTASNYLYDAAKIEFVSGKAQQKLSVKPTGATFYAGFSRANVNANWASGDLTGTPTGGAAVVAGKLDLKGGTSKRVDWSATNNALLLQEGCIRFKWTPNFNGVPVADQFLIQVATADPALGRNTVRLDCLATGDWLFRVNGPMGNLIWAESLAQASFLVPVLGQEYEIEINYRALIGDLQFHIYVNGTRKWTVSGGSYRARTAPNQIRVGQDRTATGLPNFELDDILIFPTMQHTGVSYTPDWTGVPEWNYVTDGQVAPNSTQLLDEVQALVATLGTNVRVIFEKGGVKYYHDGISWVTSDGSYAQANLIADLDPAELAAFTTIGVNFRWHLVMQGNGDTPEFADELTLTYSWTGSLPSLTESVIYGYHLDLEGNPLVGKTVTLQLVRIVAGSISVVFGTSVLTDVTDANGYFEFTLQYEGNEWPKLRWTIDGEEIITNWPRQPTVPFGDLVEIS